ncbi:hypothetical protein CEUSTIGMA_g983.t1 [Chlamydomonas eustigma]|uniref:Uncharacterized protein n=1 Tax=Chlamydomonas eustigma TaxID=1157962 RepID=A0A250WRX2_9CHLO|nr:hypothetical protein CEUSTIGMA_g983.t1 [Chlamydomonas eustigma]|eukprot:GAX73531.1 hypothetical protein CEUSTIGMA_g983.t1 [Chlamydomonas eustigma]
MRVLVAFDFDHTIVDCNSDTWIYKTLDSQDIPAPVKALYRHGYWNEFMNEVFNYLACHGVFEESMRSIIQGMPLVSGMKELLHYLHSCKGEVQYDCIIVSDSNSLFIKWALEAHKLEGIFSAVLTNSAFWEEQPVLTDALANDPSLYKEPDNCQHSWVHDEAKKITRLRISPHHAHDCQSCSHNLCKTRAIQDYMAKRASTAFPGEDASMIDKCIDSTGLQGNEASSSSIAGYDSVFFVGDGTNDVCPSSSLRAQHDAVFARKGYSLHRAIIEQKRAPRRWEAPAEDHKSMSFSVLQHDSDRNEHPSQSMMNTEAPQTRVIKDSLVTVVKPSILIRHTLDECSDRHVLAEVVVWETGFQILKWIKGSKGFTSFT